MLDDSTLLLCAGWIQRFYYAGWLKAVVDDFPYSCSFPCWTVSTFLFVLDNFYIPLRARWLLHSYSMLYGFYSRAGWCLHFFPCWMVFIFLSALTGSTFFPCWIFSTFFSAGWFFIPLRAGWFLHSFRAGWFLHSYSVLNGFTFFSVLDGFSNNILC